MIMHKILSVRTVPLPDMPGTDQPAKIDFLSERIRSRLNFCQYNSQTFHSEDRKRIAMVIGAVPAECAEAHPFVELHG